MFDWNSIFTDHSPSPRLKPLIISYLIPATILIIYSVSKWVNVVRAIKELWFSASELTETENIITGDEPIVTIQICVYNEKQVIEATMNAACRVNWPRDKLFVQVLDDSTDAETSFLIESVAARWREEGVNCCRLVRPDRLGYKAGNLSYHSKDVNGEFLAIFDADHRCEPQFLHRTVPYFKDEDVGLVQTPWAYYNTHQSILTEYDSFVQDIHHVIEQQGRYGDLQCFSFNGTGGIWRVSAIEAGGGWEWDTVTEDLDLSYLAHLAGYRFVYLSDLPQLLELPAGFLAHKQQKHRWTKGFFQVCRKSLWKILSSPKLSPAVKIEAFFHMTSAISYIMALWVFIMTPVLFYFHNESISRFLIFYSFVPCFPQVISAVITAYAKVPGSNGHYSTFLSRTRRLLYVPVIFVFSMGMCVYETRAIFDGLYSNDATFKTTPKEGKTVASGKGSDDECIQFMEEDCEKDREDIAKKSTSFFRFIVAYNPSDLLAEVALSVVGFSLAFYLMATPFHKAFIWENEKADILRSKEEELVNLRETLLDILMQCLLLVPATGLVIFHGAVMKAVARKRLKKSGLEENKEMAHSCSVLRVLFFSLLAFGVSVLLIPFSEIVGGYHHKTRLGSGGMMTMEDQLSTVLPNVQLIGAQKAGTTALADWLFQHDKVCNARRSQQEPVYFKKEVHFFDDPRRFRRGAPFYTRRFEHCPKNSLLVDATPNTLSHPDLVRNTYDKAGGHQADLLRIIVILRDPIERVLSWYNHLVYDVKYNNDDHNHIVKSDGTLMSFVDLVDRGMEGVDAVNGTCKYDNYLGGNDLSLCNGLYASYLRRWMELFRRDQILVLSFDELAHDPVMLMERVGAFLGLDEGKESTLPGKLKNLFGLKPAIKAKNSKNSKGKIKHIPCSVQARLDSLYKKQNDRLFSLLKEGEGPIMEQRPFPGFHVSACLNDDEVGEGRRQVLTV